jgi:hypothetical protein
MLRQSVFLPSDMWNSLSLTFRRIIAPETEATTVKRDAPLILVEDFGQPVRF